MRLPEHMRDMPIRDLLKSINIDVCEKKPNMSGICMLRNNLTCEELGYKDPGQAIDYIIAPIDAIYTIYGISI